MTSALDLPVARFLQTLEIVAKEGRHLTYSWARIFNQNIDVDWVDNLDNMLIMPSSWRLSCPDLGACKIQ